MDFQEKYFSKVLLAMGLDHPRDPLDSTTMVTETLWAMQKWSWRASGQNWILLIMSAKFFGIAKWSPIHILSLSTAKVTSMYRV
jgi:hypothetical protein